MGSMSRTDESKMKDEEREFAHEELHVEESLMNLEQEKEK